MVPGCRAKDPRKKQSLPIEFPQGDFMSSQLMQMAARIGRDYSSSNSSSSLTLLEAPCRCGGFLPPSEPVTYGSRDEA